MYSDITGIILSGGKSSRMGVNKSFLKIGDLYLIERTSALMKSVFSNVIIISNSPGEYKFLNLPVFEDVYKGKGPLGGIHSGLVNSGTRKNFIIACDIPLITVDAIRFIIEYCPNNTIVVPEANGFIQQLCGIYSKSSVPGIENILSVSSDEIRDTDQKKRKCSVLSLLEKTDSCIIKMETEYSKYTDYLFKNLNTQEDYQFVKNIIPG